MHFTTFLVDNVIFSHFKSNLRPRKQRIMLVLCLFCQPKYLNTLKMLERPIKQEKKKILVVQLMVNDRIREAGIL